MANIYKNGKIYKIISDQTDKVYVGSTTSNINERLSNHKERHRRHLKGKYHYVTSFDIVKFDDARIELIELYPCNSKKELLKREGIVMLQHNYCNKLVPKGLTNAEISEKSREKITCEVCGLTVLKSAYNRHLETQFHMKRMNNAEELQRKIETGEMIKCEECNIIISRDNYNGKHKNSKRHLNAIKRNDPQDKNIDTNYVTCTCGVKLRPENLEQHMTTRSHAKNMRTLQQNDEIENVIIKEYTFCECGCLHKIKYTYDHLHTKIHSINLEIKAKMLCNEDTEHMICACCMIIKITCMHEHELSKQHEKQMKYLENNPQT